MNLDGLGGIGRSSSSRTRRCKSIRPAATIALTNLHLLQVPLETPSHVFLSQTVSIDTITLRIGARSLRMVVPTRGWPDRTKLTRFVLLCCQLCGGLENPTQVWLHKDIRFDKRLVLHKT